MAVDRSSVEFVEDTHPPREDGISAQKHAENDADDIAVRDLKDVEVTLATILHTVAFRVACTTIFGGLETVSRI